MGGFWAGSNRQYLFPVARDNSHVMKANGVSVRLALTSSLTFEEVDFSIPAPDQSCVNVTGHTGEALGQFLRVATV